jgi:DHA3 family tetracycline resistance protein-like MFS transporter
MRRLDATRVYLITSFAFGLFTSAIFTLNLVYHVTTVGLNPLQLVLVGTALEAAVFLFEVPTGAVADAYSRRLSTIIGFVLMGLGFLIEGSLPRFTTVLVAQVVWGLGWTFISGAHTAWIADEVGPDRVAPVYLRGTQFDYIGSLLGIPVSVLLGTLSLNLPLLFGGATSIALAVFLAAVMPEEGFRPMPREGRGRWGGVLSTAREGLKSVRARPALLTFVMIAAFVGLSSEGYDRLWTAHILESFSFPAVGDLSSETWFGIMRAGSLILTLVATEIVKRRLDDLDTEATVRLLQLVHAGMIASALILALTDRIILAIVAYWAFRTMRWTAGPVSTALINRYVDSKVRATVLSMMGQVDAIGQVLGGPVVGLIGMVRSLRLALATTGIILSPVVPLYGRIGRQETAPGDRQGGTDHP